MEEELWYRNHFFTDGQTDGQAEWRTDRQTAMVKPVYLQNFVGGGIQTYFQYWEIEISWRESLFHDLWFNFNVEIWPVSAFNVEK